MGIIIYKKDNNEDKCITNDIKIKNRINRGSIKENDTSPTYNSFENSGGIITDNEYEIKAESDYDLEKEKEAYD